MKTRGWSIRQRLTVWNALVGLGILAVFAFGIYQAARKAMLDQLDGSLAQAFRATGAYLEEEPGDMAEFAQEGAVACFAVVSDHGPDYRSPQWRQAGLDAVLGTGDGIRFWTGSSGAEYRVFLGHRSQGGRRVRIGVAQSAAPFRENARALLFIILLALPAGFCLTLAGGYFLVGRMLAPVGKLASRARAITADQLSERLPVENPADEIGALATVLNAMLGKLEESFSRLRQFTADASHELRTPLTAMRSVGEVGLRGARSEAEYRDIIGSMLEEVKNLSQLTDGLLLLARADMGQPHAVLEDIELDALVSDEVERMRVLAEEKSINLNVEAGSGVTVWIDPTLIRQALMNLLDNAIKFTPPGGRVRVAVHQDKDCASVEVADSGPGIPPEVQDRVFERFFRLDRGRSRDIGGAGLGLAIARMAATACGGRIELESEPGQGSKFRIHIPIGRRHA